MMFVCLKEWSGREDLTPDPRGWAPSQVPQSVSTFRNADCRTLNGNEFARFSADFMAKRAPEVCRSLKRMV